MRRYVRTVEPTGKPHSTPQLILGLLFVTVGALFTMETLGYGEANRYLRYWPAGFIALGLAKIWQSRDGHGGAFGGVVLGAIGVWLLLDELNLVGANVWRFWPLLVVALGASMVWRSLTVGRPSAPGDGNSRISAVAVLGGVSRGNNSTAFRGGDLAAVMGGCEVDLRHAKIDGEAVVDVFAMWGGIEIRVPEDWTIIGRVTPLLGGFDDKTRPPATASTQRLIVRGFVIMGGVEVKN